MTRTQLRLPDELYQRAKRFAAQRELSLTEVATVDTKDFAGIGFKRVWNPLQAGA